LIEEKKRIAVIGGGFIGSELAASLTMNGAKVSLVFPGAGIGSQLFPTDLALFLNDYYREKGVDVLTGEKVTGLSETSGNLGVRLQHESTGLEQGIDADAVVAGLGTEPNIDLAQAAGVTVDDGILVDEFLRTNHPHVFAAGDVASYPDQALGKRRRVEHEDNAKSMGRRAGRNMAGEVEPYTHLPFFYSDLFDLGYEAVGEVDSRRETFEDWKVPLKEGVVYYLDDGKVCGVLLWNVWNQVDAATALIKKNERVKPSELKGRLPAES
jgi:3-phenylpropionate/trans-cinnamate dioxygenase ferredoxin reductase subunit